MQDKGWTCVSDLLQLVTDKLDFKKKFKYGFNLIFPVIWGDDRISGVVLVCVEICLLRVCFDSGH